MEIEVQMPERKRMGKISWIIVLFVSLFVAHPASMPTMAETGVEDVIHLRTRKTRTGFELYVKNNGPGIVTATLRFARLRNVTVQQKLPIIHPLTPNRLVCLATLTVTDSSLETEFDPRLTWEWGTALPQHDDEYSYSLPFRRGLQFRVSQAFNGFFSHHGRYAIDFDMPEGTRVLCARSGTVVHVESHHKIGGPERKLTELGNFVTILHADGSVGHYAHFKEDGVTVRENQKVKVGDDLGISGNTGFTAGPHLHFEVLKLIDGQRYTTIPIRFKTHLGISETLKPRRFYRHPE